MNDTSECPSQFKALEEYKLLPSWVDLVTKDAVSILGIIGNIVLIAVRMQSHMRTTFSKLLVALAVFDTLTLVAGLMYSSLKNSKKIYSYILWPLGHFVITASTFMTVVIAYERYRAVHHPLVYKRGERYRVLRYVAFVTITAFIFNVTKFFEYEPGTGSAITVMQF